ncbi:hypothetical protein B0T24DRAFT_684802 [Lasiosphaeria ovina]|uniref:Uncharacterized protein n=1 Tax=Lasiosphaeria ovina TaxID=92902 RepID=A0AAE0MXX2_9PEZI|nr:hypothetical protein B0T24DRAFT_684802 [Lasiosphaeria ovina]
MASIYQGCYATLVATISPDDGSCLFSVAPDNMRLGEMWRSLVEDCSQLRLKFDTDIFPAISGLAKPFAQALGCFYFAGFWEKTLLTDLSWFAYSVPVSMRPRPEEWRAPSWSWASVKSAVSFTKNVDVRGACGLVDLQYVSKDKNMAGELASAVIALREKVI